MAKKLGVGEAVGIFVAMAVAGAGVAYAIINRRQPPIDVEPPVVSLFTIGPENPTDADNLTISYATSDDVALSHVHVDANGVTLLDKAISGTSFTEDVGVGSLAAGQYDVTITITDASGKATSDMIQITVVEGQAVDVDGVLTANPIVTTLGSNIVATGNLSALVGQESVLMENVSVVVSYGGNQLGQPGVTDVNGNYSIPILWAELEAQNIGEGTYLLDVDSAEAVFDYP
jgi:hypothetical protein